VRFEWVIFCVAFGFSLVVTLLENSYIFFLDVFRLSLEMTAWAILIVRLFISPLVLFASFYLIGRNVDFGVRFQPVLASLFFGSWAGHLTAYFSFTLWSLSRVGFSIYSWSPRLLEYALGVVSSALSLEFFAGLSAISVAYIVRRRLIDARAVT
jgi:hypothetical protein